MPKEKLRALASTTLLSFTLSIVGASSAHAAWQWTKWYMPKNELVAASAGTAAPTRKRGVTLRNPALVADVVEYGVASTAYFQFYSDDGLQVVEIVPPNESSCDALLDGLVADLGEGDRSLDGAGGATAAFWRDKKRGNLVSYIATQGRCSLTYKMLAGP